MIELWQENKDGSKVLLHTFESNERDQAMSILHYLEEKTDEQYNLAVVSQSFRDG